MVVAVKPAATALANGSWKLLSLTRRIRRSRCCRLRTTLVTVPMRTAREAKILQHQYQQQIPPSIVLAAQNQQRQFSGTEPWNGSTSNGLGDGGHSVSPGQASITLEGGWTETNGPKKNQQQDRTPSSLFSIPIVIEMPQVDENININNIDDNNDDDDYHSFVEKWHKQPGDRLEKDDVLCDISTPDFVFGMQLDDDEAGIMGEIHAKEGLRVPCHTPICTIYHKRDGGDDDN